MDALGILFVFVVVGVGFVMWWREEEARKVGEQIGGWTSWVVPSNDGNAVFYSEKAAIMYAYRKSLKFEMRQYSTFVYMRQPSTSLYPQDGELIITWRKGKAVDVAPPRKVPH
jgi:hypothetical protein